jgi:hypothetical protein
MTWAAARAMVSFMAAVSNFQVVDQLHRVPPAILESISEAAWDRIQEFDWKILRINLASRINFKPNDVSAQ